MKTLFVPKLFTILRYEGYSFYKFYKDLVAGIIVGILALPMSIAFAVASGARPEQGLYTAIIAGFLASLFGGSRLQISGPTGAFVVIIYGIIQQYGYDGLVIATLLAGIILIVMGLCKFGLAIKFIPYPVIIGFTSGIALLIFTAQVKDFLGLPIEKLPPHFIDKWVVYFQNITHINFYHFIISVLTILIVFLWPRYITKKIPGALIAIIVGTLLVVWLHLPVETLFNRFGAMVCTPPCYVAPTFSWGDIPSLISPAISIALLAGIESLLSAIVADGMTGRKHRSNIELIGQGIANVGSCLGGGIPATGAIARTVTNIDNGGQTPIAGMIHAAVVLLVLLVFGDEVSHIPFPVLAGILMVVAYNMSEWRHVVDLFSAPKSDIAILLVTFGLTVFVDLVVAIQAGVIISAFLFINRMANISHAKDLKQALEEEEKDDALSIRNMVIPKEVDVFEIYGSLFFAAADKFKAVLMSNEHRPKILILRMRHILTIDASGIQVLKEIYHDCQRSDIVLLLSGMKPEIKGILKNSGVIAMIGESHICTDISQALERSRDLLQNKAW